jgi:hypothetical protein
VESFDLHRRGRPDTRRCVDPATVMKDGRRLVIAKSEDGHCELGQAPANGVTVWQTSSAAQRSWA